MKTISSTTRVKKSESYFVNLHDGFPGKSMKNVPNIRQFSWTYTKKIHLSYFTFDSVQRTTYTYNSMKKIIDLVLFLILIYQSEVYWESTCSWTFMNFYEKLGHGYSWTFMNIHEKFYTNIHVLSRIFMNKINFKLI